VQPKWGPNGYYYEEDMDIAVRFGGTQLQARVQWKEGVSYRVISLNRVDDLNSITRTLFGKVRSASFQMLPSERDIKISL